MKFYKNGLNYRLINADAICEELNPTNYIIMYDERNMEYYLQDKEPFKLPSKIYGKDTKFIDRVIKTYQTLGNRETLGILLNGLKGTGKTIDAELIAIESGLPILFVTDNFCDTNFKNFLSDIQQEYVLFIDEFEKIYDREHQEKLLSVFDGMLSNKKIIILTSNNDNISEFFNNRLKRIRYRKTYKNLPENTIKEVIDDLLIDKTQTDELIKSINDIGIVTMDILISIIEEMNIHNYDVIEAMDNLNIVSEKIEYKLSRVLPNNEVLFMKMINAPADGDRVSFNEYVSCESCELHNNISLDEDGDAINVRMYFDSTKHKMTKIKFNIYQIVAPITFTYYDDKEEKRINIIRDTTFILEKENLFVGYNFI
jgi:hypothetical protein